ncbi:MAG: rod shape-determining protein MreD [Peptococcia bacterium]|jgi:rod shape-determining protein MreD
MPYYVTMFLWGMVCLILQSTLFSQLMIAGVKPDLLLILIIFNCFFQGPYKGCAFGFFLGLLEDLYLGSYIGMNALTKALTSFIGGWLLKGAFRENLLVPVLALFLGSVFNGALMIFLGQIIGLNWGWNLFYWKILPMAIYNTCLVPFVYSSFYHWVEQDMEQQSL